MRTAGGIAAGVALGGCSEGGITGERTGTVRVILTGLHASATSGGTAVATPVGGGTPVTIDLPASGDQSAPAPVGDYSVTYTPPANHALGPGETFPITVSVVESQTTTVSVDLVYTAPVGTIQVNVTGLTGSPANGGSAVAQRTDAAGGPITININAAGSGSNASIPVGTYSVTYTPPGGYAVAPGVTNPVTGLAVTVGATATANFAVQQSASAPLFHSDWSTATGMTDAALLDTNKTIPWDVHFGGPAGYLEVVAATGLGFPAGMTNVLKVKKFGGSNPGYGMCRVAGKWAAPAAGQALFYRVYLRNDIADAEGNKSASSHHPLQTDPNGPWSWKFATNGNGTFPIYIVLAELDPNGYWLGGAAHTPLNKGAVYRLEWMVRRDTVTTYSFHARVYDAAGTLLFDENTIRYDGGAQPSLKSYDGTLTMPEGTGYTPPALAHLEVGSNGGPSYTNDQFYYWGGVMVRNDTWCGPY